MVMDGHSYAAIEFLDGWKTLDQDRRVHPAVVSRALENYRRQGILHKWEVLQGVAGASDSHGGNVLLSPSGQMKLIDAGASFCGPSFEPGTDPKSFVPFYLRANVQGWQKLSVESKLASMPALTKEHDHALRMWVRDLDTVKLRELLKKDNISPGATISRLEKLQTLPIDKPFYLQVHRLWLGLDGGWSGKSTLMEAHENNLLPVDQTGKP